MTPSFLKHSIDPKNPSRLESPGGQRCDPAPNEAQGILEPEIPPRLISPFENPTLLTACWSRFMILVLVTAYTSLLIDKNIEIAASLDSFKSISHAFQTHKKFYN